MLYNYSNILRFGDIMLFEEKHSKTNYYTTLEYDNILCISHCQSSFEILFVTEGCVDTVFSDRKVRVNEGECIWVLPYEIHHYETPENSKVFIAIFSADYLTDFAKAVKGKALKNPVVSFNKNDTVALKGTDLFSKKAVLYRLCAAAFKNGTEEKNGSFDNDTAARIMIYIQEHYKEQITLRDIAEELGYSYSYTSALFKSIFNKGISDVINEHRLDCAKKLLKENTHTITEIAELSGFSTIRNFNAVFKNAYNISPSQYQSDCTKGLEKQ